MGTSLLFFHCDLYEPESETANLILHVKANPDPALLKPNGTLEKMQCVVKQSETAKVVYDQTIYPHSNRLCCEIKNLNAGTSYDVYIAGYDAGNVVVSASKDFIVLKEGETKQVSITWESLVVSLITPADNAAINSLTPKFNWSAVNAAAYELQVSTSNLFVMFNINKNNITASAYSAQDSLAEDTYYWRVRAKDKNETWGRWSDVRSFTIETKIITGTVTDIDGNIYETVKIGDQWWMAENLKVTHYRNGEMIPNVSSDSEWYNLSTGAYCSYNNNESNADTYGYLYNWYAVNDSRKIAPEGWHVPTDDEWMKLEMALGVSYSNAHDTGWRGSPAGGKLKELGTTHWASPNEGATNESGFSALPGGSRSGLGDYTDIGNIAGFWSSTEDSIYYAWQRYLNYLGSDILRDYWGKSRGLSIRCIRD